jgi:hypothetical protein
MNHLYTPEHRVYLVDLEEPLLGILSVLADHCDEAQMYTQQDVLMSAINFLCIQGNTSEAIEAMSIDIETFCRYHQPQFTREQRQRVKARIAYAINRFILEMHRLFNLYRFYDKSGFLQYTFGGWHDTYTPVFVPYTHIQAHPNAISGVVQSEPASRHPGKIFYPYPPEKPDPILPW